MKICNKCQTAKEALSFYKKKSAKDGLFWWCRECHKEYVKQKYHELAKNTEYRAKEKQRLLEFRKSNPEKIRAWAVQYQQKHAEKVKERYTQYRRRYAAFFAAKTARRRLEKERRTPAWLTPDDFWMMEQAYELATLRTKMLGFAWHVDHVIPLNGALVSGLHVPHNLQVIPAYANRSKSNSFHVT